MSRPRIHIHELAAARRFAKAERAKYIKVVLACSNGKRHYRCYLCDFNGNVFQIVVSRSQLDNCERFIGRVRARVDTRARHWTELIDRGSRARYWEREVEIAIERGELIAKEIEGLREKDGVTN